MISDSEGASPSGTRPPHRLAVRLYLVGLAQILLIFAAFNVLRPLLIKPPWLPAERGWARYVTERAAAARHDPAALARELSRIEHELGVDVTLFDGAGRVIGSCGNVARPLSAAKQQRFASEPAFLVPEVHGVAISLADAAGGHDYAVVHRPPPPFPTRELVVALALVLIGVALSAALLARSLVLPLGQLAKATRAFGSGVLTARAGLRRRDELGEVADAFDETAERVTRLISQQRELLANVSHELRTPLARISVALDLAEEGPREGMEGSLREIRAELDELNRLVGDLLSVARLDLAVGGIGPFAAPLHRQPIAAGGLVRQAEARFRALHPQHPLEVEIDPALGEVMVDGELVQRAIENLLDNAAKYSEPGSPVRLVLRRDDRDLLVEVADRGIGIDPKDLPQLFQPFFRTDRSRARATGGVGLGLALVRRIAEAHGGAVSAECAEDRTVFCLRVPLADA